MPSWKYFSKGNNYHMSVCWEIWGIQKQEEVVGRRSKVRKSRLLSVGARFVRVSQAVRCCFYVPLRPKAAASREIRLSSEVTCFPDSRAHKTLSFQKGWWEGLIGVSTLPQPCSLWVVWPSQHAALVPPSTKPALLLYSQIKKILSILKIFQYQSHDAAQLCIDAVFSPMTG